MAGQGDSDSKSLYSESRIGFLADIAKTDIPKKGFVEKFSSVAQGASSDWVRRTVNAPLLCAVSAFAMAVAYPEQTGEHLGKIVNNAESIIKRAQNGFAEKRAEAASGESISVRKQAGEPATFVYKK